METSIKIRDLSATDILRDIKAKRNNFDKLNPLIGRKWYLATGQNIKEFNDRYPQNIVYESHYFIMGKDILDAVVTNLLKEDKVSEAGIAEFLKNKNSPSYIFNYCFDFK
jgi:hypothetical protein